MGILPAVSRVRVTYVVGIRVRGRIGRRRTTAEAAPRLRSVAYKADLICHVLTAEFIIMDSDPAVRGQAGGFDPFPLGIGVADIFREFEMDWFGWRLRFQHQSIA